MLQDMAFEAVLPQEPFTDELPRERSARLRERADGLMIIAASLMRESSELIRTARIQIRDSKAIQSGLARSKRKGYAQNQAWPGPKS